MDGWYGEDEGNQDEVGGYSGYFQGEVDSEDSEGMRDESRNGYGYRYGGAVSGRMTK